MRKALIVGLLATASATFSAGRGEDLAPVQAEVRRPPRTDGTLSAIGVFHVWHPLTITAPGVYVVSRNIEAPEPVIVIRSSDVELDLGGFTLEGTSGVQPVILVAPQVLENVTIRDGRVRGGNTCLFIDRVSRLRVSGLDLAGCNLGLVVDDNDVAVVEHNGIVAGSIGLSVDNCNNCRISDNAIEGGIEFGLVFGNGVATEISGNRITGSTTALAAGGQGLLVRDNLASGSGDGIRLTTLNSLIEGNVTAANGRGMVFEAQASGNVYRANTARGNADADFEDAGDGNTSGGGNFLPHAM